jgi:hypothetical protein
LRLPFRIQVVRQIEVRLHVELAMQSGRLVDLIQLLAHAGAVIADLKTDRSMDHLAMPERSAEVIFLVSSWRHKNAVLNKLSAKGFTSRELPGRMH